MKKKSIIATSLLLIVGCNNSTETEIYQSSRDNIIDVKSYIHEIDLGNVYVGNSSRPSLINDYLVISDFKAFDKPINLFDRKTYKYMTSFGEVGQGPKEITSLGDVAWNGETHEIYVTDHGKQVILAYELDSVLSNNKDYYPIEKYHLNNTRFPSDYYYINDSVSYCRTIEPIGNNDFAPSTGVWNMKTGSIKTMKYNHPSCEKKRFMLAVSYADNIYAECNVLYDLISFFDLNGNLIKNIYGPEWGDNNLHFFGVSTFTKDYLITAYNGDVYEKHTPNHYCMVFSKEGEYTATLDLGYNTGFFCYDEQNDRLIFSFDDVIQFGYLNLEEIKL